MEKVALQEHIQDYLTYCRQMGRAEGTIRWHQTGLGRFQKWCERNALVATEDVSKRHIRAYWAFLQENLTGVATAASSVRAFFSWLETEEEIKESPVRKAGFPKDKRETIEPLSSKEIEKLVAATKTGRNPLRDAALILFLYDTGLRISEALNIEMHQMDMQNAQVSVFGKMGKNRTVVFSYRTTRALRQYQKSERPGNKAPNLFLTDEGDALNRRAARLMLRRFATKIGLEPIRVSPHKLRHSFAVGFLRNGGGALHLQAMLGHSTLDMTKRYVTFSGQDIAEAHHRFSPVSHMHDSNTGDW